MKAWVDVGIKDNETYEGLSSLEECREKANMIIIENDYKNSATKGQLEYFE